MNFAQADIWLFRHGNLAAAPSWLDAFFVRLTNPPDRALLFGALWLALILLGGARGRRAAVALVFAVALSDWVASGVLKHWVERVRPCFVLADVRLLLPHQARSPSFPSSHAANSFAAAVVLFHAGRRLGLAGLAIAALIAFSRVYVGVHYPSDVLAGAALGAAFGYAALAVLRAVPVFRWPFRGRESRAAAAREPAALRTAPEPVSQDGASGAPGNPNWRS